MQGVAQLTTGFSNKYDCDIKSINVFRKTFLLIFWKNQTVSLHYLLLNFMKTLKLFAMCFIIRH